MSDLIDRNLIGDLVDSNGNVHYEDIMNIPSLELPPVQPVDKDINVSCKDAISRQAAIDALANYIHNVDKVCGMGKLLSADDCKDAAKRVLDDLPSIQPTYTEAQLQKMQDLEQVQLEKVFDLGREDAKEEIVRCKDCRWQKDQSGSTAWLPCRALVTPDDFYCGRAERRTDGEIIPE